MISGYSLHPSFDIDCWLIFYVD